MIDEKIFTKKRHDMVEQQIARRGIKDPAILKAMRKVHRHLFIPEKFRKTAYDDSPVFIEEGQTISQPYIVALMAQAAQLTPESKILDVGTGSGYAAAILSLIAKEVYTIERIPELTQRAEERFKSMGYGNIKVKVGDGTLGWKEHAPYHAILVAAGAPEVPKALVDQLTDDGCMIIPVGDDMSQKLLRIRKTTKGHFSKETIEYVHFVPLIGKEGWAYLTDTSI